MPLAVSLLSASFRCLTSLLIPTSNVMPGFCIWMLPLLRLDIPNPHPILVTFTELLQELGFHRVVCNSITRHVTKATSASSTLVTQIAKECFQVTERTAHSWYLSSSNVFFFC